MNDNKKEDIVYESVVIAIILIVIGAIIYNVCIIKYFQIPECIIYNRLRDILSWMWLHKGTNKFMQF